MSSGLQARGGLLQSPDQFLSPPGGGVAGASGLEEGGAQQRASGTSDGGHEGGGDDLEDSPGRSREVSGLLGGIELGDHGPHSAIQVVPVVGVSDGSVQLGQLGAVLGGQ